MHGNDITTGLHSYKKGEQKFSNSRNLFIVDRVVLLNQSILDKLYNSVIVLYP